MKIFLLGVFILLLAICVGNALAGDLYIRKNRFIDNRYDIYNDGERVGYIKRNWLRDEQWDVYDSNGRRTVVGNDLLDQFNLMEER